VRGVKRRDVSDGGEGLAAPDGLAAAMLVPVVVAAGLTPSPFLRGLLPGGGSVGALGALWLWVVQATGTASLAMGELAAQ
jgi:hypothetical protein